MSERLRFALLAVASLLAAPTCTHAPDPPSPTASSCAAPSPTPSPASPSSMPSPSAPSAFRIRRRSAPAGTHTGKPITADVYLYTRSRNPVDAAGRTAFARPDDTCF